MSAAPRPIVALACLLFGASLTFPIVASLGGGETFGLWFGVADVAVAATLIAFTIVAGLFAATPTAGAALASLAIVRAGSYLGLVLFVVYLVFRDTVQWDILMPGLAWRMWLLVQVLPALVTLAREGRS